jgi:hypothetical protein
MLAEAILLFPSWTAYEILSLFLYPNWHPLFIAAAAIPVGFTLSTWYFFIVNLFAPLSPIQGIALVILCLAVSVFVRRPLSDFPSLPARVYRIVASSFFLFVFLTDQFFLKGGIASLGTVSWDLLFHLTLITSFTHGVNCNRTSFWPFTTPFHAHSPLLYPIFPDFHSAALFDCGCSLRLSIVLPTILLGVSFTALLYLLLSRLTEHKYVPELGLFLYCVAGGSGWRHALDPVCWADSHMNFIHRWKYGDLFWLQPVLQFLLPQRSAIYSMPMVLTALICLIEGTKTVRFNRRLLGVAGVTASLIPLQSGHSFVAISMYAAFFALFGFLRAPVQTWLDSIKAWLFFGVPLLVFALPQLLIFTSDKSRGLMFSVDPIWREYLNGTSPILLFWWASLSDFVMIAAFHAWFVLDRLQIQVYLPGFAVFAISNIVRYQVGAMNNSKVMLAVWHPFASLAVAEFIAKLWGKKGKILKVVAAIFLIEMSTSTILCCIQKPRTTRYLLPEHMQDYGFWVIENVPVDAVVLTEKWGITPVSVLAGRYSFLSFVGWTGSHGINTTEAEAVKKQINTTKCPPEFFRKHGISYAEHFRSVDRVFEIDEFDAHWQAVYVYEDTKLYQLIEDPFGLSLS